MTHDWKLAIFCSLYDNDIYQHLVAFSLSFFIARGIFRWALILTKFRLIFVLFAYVTDSFNWIAILILVGRMVSSFSGKEIRKLYSTNRTPIWDTITSTSYNVFRSGPRSLVFFCKLYWSNIPWFLTHLTVTLYK